MDLSLPHDTIEISALLPKVQAALVGVDANLASEYLMTAAIDFTTESRIMRVTRCINIISCVTSYPIDVSPYKITEVSNILLEGPMCSGNSDILGLCRVEGKTLYIDEQLCADSSSRIIIEFVVSLKRSSSYMPEELYEDWEPTIVSGALAELYLVGSAEWANRGLSDRHAADFARGIKRARFLKNRKHRPLALRLSPKWRSR